MLLRQSPGVFVLVRWGKVLYVVSKTFNEFGSFAETLKPPE